MDRNTKFTALYERLSHDDELQGDSFSIIHQKELLTEYSRSHGFLNVRHFTDDGISGTRFDRPGFLQLMKEVEAGHVSCICVKDLSRLGRDYLKVGQIMEMLRQKGVRLIAINDGVDTEQGEDEFMPFRNLLNEFYARDTSKKIKSVFQAKGRAGKHVASNPPYGYLKDPEDNNHWLVDEEAAAVIRYIFQLTLKGYGPYQISTILEDSKVDIPAYHQQKLGIGLFQTRELKYPYRWSSSTVVGILNHREYLGHTVNFKTAKHFKDSHSHYVDASQWVVFEDTQEPIIDQDTFDRVQKIRSNVKRWPNGWGPAHPLTGLLFCADCGGKLYEHRIDNNRPVSKFGCGNYTRKKCPSGHRIDAATLLNRVGQALATLQTFIQEQPDAFLQSAQEAISSQQSSDIKQQRRRLQECHQRRDELEKLICRIYEDNILGKLPDKRYELLNHQYEAEITALETECGKLQELVDSYVDGGANARKFMALIARYDNFDSLSIADCNELIDHINVHEKEYKGRPQSPQQVDIYFRYIGLFIPPEEPVDPEVAAAQEEKRRKIEAKKKRLHQNYLKRKANGKQAEYERRYEPRRQARMRELKAALPQRGIPLADFQKQQAALMTAKAPQEGEVTP